MLDKKFIKLSYTFYSSLILFIKKDNNNLKYYIDYYKLIKLIKKNYYPLLPIKDILAYIYRSKYLIRLYIITIFNKHRMYPNSKDLITFTILLEVNKYKFLSFRLTKSLILY